MFTKTLTISNINWFVAFMLMFACIAAVSYVERSILTMPTDHHETRLLIVNNIPWGEEDYRQFEMTPPGEEEEIPYIWAGEYLAYCLLDAWTAASIKDWWGFRENLYNFFYLLFYGKGYIATWEATPPPVFI